MIYDHFSETVARTHVGLVTRISTMMIFYYLNFLLHAHNRKQEGRLTHLNFLFFIWFLVGFMVFNATFNNILALLWRSVLLVEKTGGPGENHQPVASD